MSRLQQIGRRPEVLRSDERHFTRAGACRRLSESSYAHGVEEKQRSGYGQQQTHSNLPLATRRSGAAMPVAVGDNSLDQTVQGINSQSGARFGDLSPLVMHHQQQQLPSPSSAQQFQLQPLQRFTSAYQQANTQLPQQYRQQHVIPQQQRPQPRVQHLSQQSPAPLTVRSNGLTTTASIAPSMHPNSETPNNGVETFGQQSSNQPSRTPPLLQRRPVQRDQPLQTHPAAVAQVVSGGRERRELLLHASGCRQLAQNIEEHQNTNLAEDPVPEERIHIAADPSDQQRPLPQSQLEQLATVASHSASHDEDRTIRQQQARRTTPSQLDAEERDSRLLELLSLCGVLEPPQAIALLEASDWHVNDAFMAILTGSIGRARRQARVAYDADVEEAIRRSMIDEHYSGSFAAEGLSVGEIFNSTTTTVYRCASSDIEEGEQCAICLEAFKDGDVLRVLGCQHNFHMNCIDQWLPRSGQCAVCKQSVVDASNSN